MKTAKPSVSASEALPGRRSQPLRQTRTNPPRSSAFIPSSGRTGGRDSVSGPAGHDQPIDIFPAVTHFADAITALPKELVRHFTLLKEVDAKIYAPQQSLFRLINTALRMPAPNSTRSPFDGSDIDPAKAAADAAAATAASLPPGSGRLPPLPPPPPAATSNATEQAAYDASNLPRRQLFRQVASEIRDMLVALEEKKHVISTANDALNKQLARIDDIWPHLEQEFSDEAKWGSTTHWAYPENRASNNAQAERSRREGAASLSAAAQQIADEAAARSDARKQAVAARRSQKAAAAHQDSDADDLQQNKKSGGGSKSRKTLPDPSASVGLGISSVGANGSSSKRRKAEKPTASGAPMERALSGVFGAAAGSGGKTMTSSPRGSPAPDAKKRKALPANGSQTKKSRNCASAASSPVISALPDVKNGRNPPTSFPPFASEDMDRSVSNGAGPGRGFDIDSKGSTGGNTQTDEMMIDAPINETSLFARSVSENTKQPVASTSISAGHGDDKMMNSGLSAGRSGTNVGGINSMGYSNGSVSNRVGGMTSNGPNTALTAPSAGGTQEISAGRGVGGSRDVSGREAATSALLPALRDSSPHGPRLSSAVQMVALDPNRQRRPSPLSLAATPDSRQANSSPLVLSATAGADAASYVNGLRVSAGKPTKDATAIAAAGATMTTPTMTLAPAPSPKSAAAPEAAILTPPQPVTAAQAAPAVGPVAVPSTVASEALKIEPFEVNHGSTMDSVTMTRTRSASLLENKKERESKDGNPNNGAGAATDKSLDNTVAKKEPTPTMQAPFAALSSAQAPTVTTKSGRASRPSTPAHSTFAEPPMPGTTPASSRPARGSEGPVASSAGGSNGSNNGLTAGSRKNNGGSSSSSASSSNGGGSGGAAASTNANSIAASAAVTSTAFKRSHKKGASSVSAHQAQHQAHSSHGRSQSVSHNQRGGAGDSDWQGGGGSGGAKSKQVQQQKQLQEQGQEEEDDDPLYCYCNRVSFGEMIACDAVDCKREWFHLECVGLRVAPKTSVKWYCDDCKKRLRANERKR